MRTALPLALLTLALVGCGPSEPRADKSGEAAAAMVGRPLPTGPVLTGSGVIVGVDGARVTLDTEAVEGGVAAGRTVFVADSAVLAEAPLDPGARVAFSYQDWTPQPLLTEMKAR